VNGLLSRLGARAIGQAGAVHSIARLPFAAAPNLALEAEAQIGQGSAAPMDLPADLTRWSAPDLPPIAAAPGLTEAGPPGALAAPRSTRAVPPPAPLVPSAVAARTSAKPLASDLHPAGRAAPDAREGLDRRAPTPEPTHPGALTVAPLLPPQPIPPRSAWFPQAPAPDRDWTRDRQSAAQPTEVQVSIGRIEVTAVHEPPPPRRPGPRPSAATTLDDYLAQRRGGRGGAAP
jgi:hypothetical protein